MEPETEASASVSAPDVIVVGAGIFGLSVALSCRAAGLSVRVLEAGRVGQGASGGVVGALTPHAPSRWRTMMAFQFQALVTLEDRIAQIEAASGCSAGYARTGRLTPLDSVRAREKAEADALAAPAVWGDAARFEVVDAIPSEAHGWIAPEAAAHGLIHDTLSARVDPRAYLAALATALEGYVEEGVEVIGLDPDAPAVSTTDGRRNAGTVVLAAGTALWTLCAPHAPALAGGGAVKGQAAVLVADAPGLPLVWQQGLYVIPHGAGRVAVGSTSEKRFDHLQPDALLDDVIGKARAIVPALAEAEVIERWAGLRPKPPGREPVVGPLPGHPRSWIAGGGYKIGFGIAHAVGDAVAAGITGAEAPIPLPESFAPEA